MSWKSAPHFLSCGAVSSLGEFLRPVDIVIGRSACIPYTAITLHESDGILRSPEMLTTELECYEDERDDFTVLARSLPAPETRK